MDHDYIKIQGLMIPVIRLNTVIVGTGCAGYNAADSLYSMGQRDIAIVTEGVNMGTSRNTGSDKQTYYKLTMEGGRGDSVRAMAQTLFSGGSMHGDIALVEAALSAKSFYKLAEAGVPFPHNRYGEYVGYRTDHDSSKRATSAGPLTSKYMTEALQKKVNERNIPIFDGHRVVSILTGGEGEDRYACGLAAIDMNKLDTPHFGITLFNCTNIIYATGGPAGMYQQSVYPESQSGASGIAYLAGAEGINLTESQYGIASVKFRWNLSGTYQQVIPRYLSTDKNGGDAHEFLDGYFADTGAMLDAIFQKGYGWPFDPAKIAGAGSSLIDILVYNETQIKGRRVFLDFVHNPCAADKNGTLDFELLSDESREYLRKSGALLATPIERLMHMNKPAIKLYADNGIDITNEYLEIAVCAQHNNGGLMGNIWWESNLKHFFPVGEANGTFGVHRPGGTALNSTQVGSYRAAQYINQNYDAAPPNNDDFAALALGKLNQLIANVKTVTGNIADASDVFEKRGKMRERMSASGAHIRSYEACYESLEACKRELGDLLSGTKIASLREYPEVFINYDIALTQYVYLSAIIDYIKLNGKSRGSYLIYDKDGTRPAADLPEIFRYTTDGGAFSDKVLVSKLDAQSMRCTSRVEPVRPIPDDENWFETVWNDTMNGKVIK